MKRFPTLQSDLAAAATEALERFRDESRKTVLRLVDMESSYLTVEFFRKINSEQERGPNRGPNSEKEKEKEKKKDNYSDNFSDNHLKKIGT